MSDQTANKVLQTDKAATEARFARLVGSLAAEHWRSPHRRTVDGSGKRIRLS